MFNKDAGRLYKDLELDGVSMVQQHFRDEVDINTIVRRFGVTGQIPDFLPQGVYGDFQDVDDYDSAVAAIERANDGFMRLPAEVREQFNNDPGVLIRLAQSVSEDELGNILFPTPAQPANSEIPAT